MLAIISVTMTALVAVITYALTKCQSPAGSGQEGAAGTLCCCFPCPGLPACTGRVLGDPPRPAFAMEKAQRIPAVPAAAAPSSLSHS